MRATGTIILLYGLIILVGGFFGHYKSGSNASLISGLVFGILLLGSAYATFKKKPLGEYAALVLTFILDGFFTYRYITGRQFLPAGLLCLISLFVLFILAMILKRRLDKAPKKR